MARPIKKGLDYFPLNTDFMNNRTIRRLKRKGGFKAIVLYMDLLCDIYANSYFIEITDNYIFDLSDQLGLEEKDIRSMIEIMIVLGLFHERSFDKSHILTSETIQEQYAFSKSKRPDNKAVIDLYKIVNDVKTEVFADETPQNDTKSAYSIVKERKENITTTSSPARTYAREEILRSYRDELSNDEDWRAAIVRMSGKGPAVLDLLPGVMELFESHIVSTGDMGTLRTKNDYARRFTSWWRCLDYQPEADIINRPAPIAPAGNKRPAAPSRIEEAMKASERAAQIALNILQADGHDRSRA